MMTQQEAYSYFFPEIRDNGQEYYKTCLIYAYPAQINEFIETWTADGLETTNYAKEGDFIVQNLQTECQEKYIVPHPDGSLSMDAPKIFDTSRPLRLRGKGYSGGDMYVKLNVKFQRPI